MKFKELLPVIEEETDIEISIVNTKDSFEVINVESALTVEDTKLLNKYKELEVESFEPVGGCWGDTYLAIYLIGDGKEY